MPRYESDGAGGGGGGSSRSPVFFGSGNTVGAGQTRYIADSFSLAVEERTKTPVPRDGDFSNMFVHLSAAPGGVDTQVMTLRVNGANTLLTVTITGAATTGNNVADTVAVNQGDEIDVSIVSSATAAAASVNVGMEYSE